MSTTLVLPADDAAVDQPPSVGAPTRAETLAARLDAACVVIAGMLALQIWIGAEWYIRPVNALLVAVFVPGWVIVRSFGAGLEPLTVAAGVAASVATTILVGQSMVLAGTWSWDVAGVVVCAVSVAAGARLMRVHRRALVASARSDAAGDDRRASFARATSALGVAFVLVGLTQSQDQQFDPIGLIAALSPIYWLGVGIILVSFVSLVGVGSGWAWLNLSALVVVLHGLPGLLEPHPRFNVAWLHVGFADHIADNGTLLYGLDGRFSWAGFFSGGGLLQRWAATDDLLWLVRFSPLFYNAMAILLMVSIGKALRMSDRQLIAAGVLFCMLNWIGQDYFAPQATGFLLYYTIIAVVLRVFPGAGLPASRRLGRWLRAGETAPSAGSGPAGLVEVAALVGVVFLIAALVVTHQLTPGFLTSALALLVLMKSTRLRWLPLVVGVAFMTWLSYGADAYWVGHFDNLFGSVGQVGDLLDRNVSERTRPSAVAGRSTVVGTRLGIAFVMWSVASAAFVSDWWRRRAPVALAVLVVAPFPMLLVQPYGGEMLLRICFFTVPPSALLIALAFVHPEGRSSFSLVRTFAGAAALGVLAVGFVVARFGNESFEAFADGDVAVARAMYDIVPDGATVFVADRQTIAYSERVDAVRFRTLPDGPEGNLDDAMGELRRYGESGDVFVLLADSQEVRGVLEHGRTLGWIDEFAAELRATGQFEVRAQAGGAILLEMVGS